MTIGELAARTGVAATALRYYDELGLVRPSSRVGGQRRYDEESVRRVGVVVFLREVGFTLEEIRRFLRGDDWADAIRTKLDELAVAAANIAAAQDALEHALACPAGDPMVCPTFWSIVDERLPRAGSVS